MEQEQQEQGQSKPQKTWFFERGDGKIFATGEREAWDLLHNQSNWARRDFKMLGMSDGQIYFDTIKNSKKEANYLLEKKAILTRDKEKYLQTEDRLRFQELKDDDDEMVIKVVNILSDLNEKIEDIDSKLANFNKDIVEKAFNLELEKARGNMVSPDDHDVITPKESDRNKILMNLPR